MGLISDDIRRLVEEPSGLLEEPPPPARRIITPTYTLGLAPTPTQAFVSALRTTSAALDGTIAEIRAQIRGAGYTRAVWTIGPSSRPDGLRAALIERGFFPPTEAPFEPELIAMVLVEPPPPAPPGVEARLVRDFDEYLQSMRIAVATMGESESEDSGWLGAARGLWDQENGPARLTHVAFLDGEMVGFAWAASAPGGLMLCGGGVRPKARGRGAYRALVAARWETAVRLGTPALAIQAGAMSGPILARCGFQTLFRLDVLQDPEVR